MKKNSNKTTFFRYNVKQNWYKNLEVYLKQTSRTTQNDNSLLGQTTHGIV